MEYSAVFPVAPGESVYAVMVRPSTREPIIYECKVHSCTIHADGVPRISYYPRNAELLSEFAGGIEMPVNRIGEDVFLDRKQAERFCELWRELH